MDAILKFTHSKFARGLIGGLCGAILIYTLLFTAFGFFNWFALKSGMEEPSWAPTFRLSVLGIAVGWAIISGLIAGSGMFNNRRIGRFFYC